MEIYCFSLKRSGKFYYLRKPIVVESLVTDIGKTIYERFSPDFLVLLGDSVLLHGNLKNLREIEAEGKKYVYELILGDKNYKVFDFTEYFDAAFEEFRGYVERELGLDIDWTYDHFTEPDVILPVLEKIDRRKEIHYLLYNSSMFYENKVFELGERNVIILVRG